MGSSIYRTAIGPEFQSQVAIGRPLRQAREDERSAARFYFSLLECVDAQDKPEWADLARDLERAKQRYAEACTATNTLQRKKI